MIDPANHFCALRATSVLPGFAERHHRPYGWQPQRSQNPQQSTGKRRHSDQPFWCHCRRPSEIPIVLPKTATSKQHPIIQEKNEKGGLLNVLSANPLTALGPTSSENLAASLGGHPLAESVAVRSFHVTRLKCPFHGTLLSWLFVSAGKFNETSSLCQEKHRVINSIKSNKPPSERGEKTPTFPGTTTRRCSLIS